MTHRIVIVDYGAGNLYSIERALDFIGVQAEVVSTPEKIAGAERIILPGVGAFKNGMRGLSERGLVGPLQEYVRSGRPLLGICLGMQLLMSESEEFGRYDGLNMVKGKVVRLDPALPGKERFKVPHVGWSRVIRRESSCAEMPDGWTEGVLKSLPNGFFANFAHSFVVVPEDGSACIAQTKYGGATFCSCLQQNNLYGCQFHPERSGIEGLEIYRDFVRRN